MKKVTPIFWSHAIAGMIFSVILFSFTRTPYYGGHSFQIYLDNKMILDQPVNFKADAPKVVLDPTENNIQLMVKYNECGRTVTGRAITLKDHQNKVLKEWRFEGSSVGFKESMSCPVKDILAQQQGGHTLKLYYSSREFPEGQQIVYLVIGNKSNNSSK